MTDDLFDSLDSGGTNQFSDGPDFLEAFVVAAAAVCLLALLLLSGCRSVQYVPVETVRHDSIYITKHQKDSIYVHDSIYQREKGDTLIVEKWHTRYIERLVHDTTYVEKVDSIQVPYTVEKQLTKWQRMKMNAGGWAIGLCIVSLLFIIMGFIFRKKT